MVGEAVAHTVFDEETDRYGRLLLRYVNVGALDAGYRQIRNGYAIARYDSCDGYGFHPREPAYVKAEKVNTPSYTCVAPPTAPPTDGGGGCTPGYSPRVPFYPPDVDCADVNGPIYFTEDDPHGLDADGDGVACH